MQHIRPLFRDIRQSFRLLASAPPRRDMSAASDEVLFDVRNGVGIATLNRPKALNSLNNNIVCMLYEELREWEKTLSMVVVEGAGGRAFCAGGDVRTVTQNKASKEQKAFFVNEYRLNHLVGTVNVPYVALIDGIVMGGGVGISVHRNILN